MKAKYLFVPSLLILFIITIGCNKDDGPETQSGCLNQSWGEQTKAEVDAVNAAATTFATAPNVGTCENFRAAYIEYIEALEKLEPCVLLANRNAFSTALDKGKVELQNLNCNQDFD